MTSTLAEVSGHRRFHVHSALLTNEASGAAFGYNETGKVVCMMSKMPRPHLFEIINLANKESENRLASRHYQLPRLLEPVSIMSQETDQTFFSTITRRLPVDHEWFDEEQSHLIPPQEEKRVSKPSGKSKSLPTLGHKDHKG